MTTLYKFKKSILFVVLYMGICVMTETTLPDFDCDTNGDVILRNATDLAKIVIVKADETLCRPVTTNITGSCGQVPNTTITIAYGDHVQIGNDMIGGDGSNYTKLSCKDTKILVSATVKNVFGTPTKLPEHDIDIVMKYAIKLSINGLSNSKSAKLGEKFTLFLEGPDIKHSLQPTECKAYPSGQPTNEHVIWNFTIPATGKCFHETSVIKEKWTTVVKANAKKTKLSIEMYAFRFATSASVTIECSAYVCPKNDNSTECTKKCIDNTRRRRDIHGIQTSPKRNITSTKVMVAFTSFEVQLGDENQNTENSAARLSKNLQLYSVTSILVLMVTMMIR